MKLKNIFPLFIAMLAFLVSCDENESATLLDEIQVSSSYVAIPIGGGAKEITVTAKDSWTLEKVTTDKDKVEWLVISTSSGSAGESKITFSAESALDARNAEVLLHSAGKTQRINVMQGLPEISDATVAEIIAGPEGKTFRVTGVCTKIENTVYGNWHIEDETGSIFIYGTLDAKGESKNFLSLDIEVGDEVTVEGPRKSHNGVPQLVDVMMIKLNKSLIKVDSVENEVLPIDGGIFTTYLSVKGQGVSVDIPENAKDWLSIASVESAGEDVVVNFQAAPNAGGDRSTVITFRTIDASGKKYSTETSLSQKGAIIKASIAEFKEADEDDTLYRLSGTIQEIQNDKYGNVVLRDFSGEVLVYGIKDFPEKDLRVSDIIIIVGKRTSFSGTVQVGSAYLEESIPVTTVTIEEFLAKPDAKDVYYMVTGEIDEITNQDYGNMIIKDGDNKLTLYGCYPGYGATGDFRKGIIAVKGIKVGDQITAIGTKNTFNGVIQLDSGIYFSHVSAD